MQQYQPLCCLQVVGHVKTVIILMGGCLFFGDQMPLKKLAGISVAMFGIIWYSQVSSAQEALMMGPVWGTQRESAFATNQKALQDECWGDFLFPAASG